MSEFNKRFSDASVRIAALKHNLVGYHTQELEMIQTSDIWRLGTSGVEYIERMNLRTELDFLIQQTQSPIVWEVGSGTTEPISEVAQEFDKIQYLAINPHILPRPWNTPITVPFEEGVIEELADDVVPRAQKRGLFPPNMIIASNVLHYSFRNNTLDLALWNMSEVLPSNGSILAYLYLENQPYY